MMTLGVSRMGCISLYFEKHYSSRQAGQVGSRLFCICNGKIFPRDIGSRTQRGGTCSLPPYFMLFFSARASRVRCHFCQIIHRQEYLEGIAKAAHIDYPPRKKTSATNNKNNNNKNINGNDTVKATGAAAAS